MKPDSAFSVDWADEEILRFLSTLKSVRLTGSFARVYPSQNSDLDFRLNNSDLQELKKYLRLHESAWNSDLTGHITHAGMEFFDAFHRIPRAERAEFVRINGVTFKTW